MSRGSASAQTLRYALRLLRCCISIGESSRFRPFAQTTSCDLLFSSLVDLGDAHCSQQRQIVLDVPIVGDAAVLDLDEVGGDEGYWLALALRLPEPAGEMTGEVHMHSDVVACDDYLLHRNLEVGNGGAEPA